MTEQLTATQEEASAEQARLEHQLASHKSEFELELASQKSKFDEERSHLEIMLTKLHAHHHETRTPPKRTGFFS